MLFFYDNNKLYIFLCYTFFMLPAKTSTVKVYPFAYLTNEKRIDAYSEKCSRTPVFPHVAVFGQTFVRLPLTIDPSLMAVCS